MVNKTVPDEFKSIPELIHSIEKKDRRFRVAQTVFMIAILIPVAIGGYFLATNQTKERIAREEQTSQIIDRQSEKIDDLTNRLRCLAVFFSEPDRANLIITDIDQCFTQRIDNGDIRKLDIGSDPANTNQNSNNTDTSHEDTQKKTDQNNLGNQNENNNSQTPVDPPSVGLGEEENPPRRIAGIPVCIPFTEICVRE